MADFASYLLAIDDSWISEGYRRVSIYIAMGFSYGVHRECQRGPSMFGGLFCPLFCTRIHPASHPPAIHSSSVPHPVHTLLVRVPAEWDSLEGTKGESRSVCARDLKLASCVTGPWSYSSVPIREGRHPLCRSSPSCEPAPLVRILSMLGLFHHSHTESFACCLT